VRSHKDFNIRKGGQISTRNKGDHSEMAIERGGSKQMMPTSSVSRSQVVVGGRAQKKIRKGQIYMNGGAYGEQEEVNLTNQRIVNNTESGMGTEEDDAVVLDSKRDQQYL